MAIELNRAYVHKTDEDIRVGPHRIDGDMVELNLSRHGILETGVMSIADFEEQFAREKES